ncbi:hypothetical protein [Undibacterium terreum]|uniref:Uncharacterized protein n=1 Tax=Undibacterium terreum TaxID=1224302 RepID=A0A916UDB6_9BURK|nr:hypothetical protein [Undibacterium terreum]GGC68073.1 hypothetical protein GCM10011396_13930 [Undibacterium terreum]
MNNQTDIKLSGPFSAKDSSGQLRNIKGIRIFDEGYGMIDVYVDFASGFEDDPLHEDQVLINAIIRRLRTLGYRGPDFGLADAGLQDDRLIVLQAPEPFNEFAASKGWRNLAEEFADDDEDLVPDSSLAALISAMEADALIRRLRAH